MATNVHISQTVWVLRQKSYYKQFVTTSNSGKLNLTNQIALAQKWSDPNSAVEHIAYMPQADTMGPFETVPVEIRLKEQEQ